MALAQTIPDSAPPIVAAEPEPKAAGLPILAVSGLFFLSGATIFTFQVLWLRGLAPILGTTVYAMSAATAAFMAGLAIGSLGIAQVLVRIAFVRTHFLAVFGVLQLLSASLGAAITYLLFERQTDLIAMVSALTPDGDVSRTMVVHALVSFAILALPVAMTGCALPLLATGTNNGSELSRLYGIHTIGAAVGCVLSGFVLIERFGCLNVAYFAAAAGGVVCVLALLLARSDRSGEWRDPAIHAATPRALTEWSTGTVVATAAFSGVVSLAYEVAILRFLALLLGDRIFVTTLALTLVLACLGIGAWLAPILRRRIGTAAAAVCASAGAIVAIGVALAIEGVVLSRTLPNAIDPFESNDLVRILFLTFLVVLPMTAIGLLFPLALAAAVERPSGAVRVAYVSAINTAAGIAGSLLGSYLLLGAIGSNGTLVMTAALLLGYLAVMVWSHPQRSRVLLTPAAIAVCSVLVLVIPNATRYPRTTTTATVLATREDAHGLFNVLDLVDGTRTIYQNNVELVTPAGYPITQYTQELMAYYPALFAPTLDDILIVGLGYGITAGAMARIDEVRRIDALEIAPAVADHVALFDKFNYRFYTDPRMTLIVDDARQFLATRERRYDLVTINPTNPYQPGNASLYSQEFYALLKRRLKPGGVLCQHLFGPDMATLYHGIARQFRYVAAIPGYSNTVVILASDAALQPHQRDLYLGKYEQARALFDNIMIDSLFDLEGLIREGERILRSYDARTPAFVNSDVYPALEFRRFPGRLDLWDSNRAIDLGR